LIILAAITKRAQIPFSAWLPAAIAAPTPVRALVHSSTLVTAGVYLLIRFYPLLKRIFIFKILFYIGLATTFIASRRAMFEIDLKKVVALSTLGQLGLIISAIGAGLPLLAYFHIIVHALFKALLFICRGKVIHITDGFQDLRFIGSISHNLSYTIININLANLALCGIPFLAGFYSKDGIIEKFLRSDRNLFNYIIYIFVVGLSTVYSLRLVITRIIKPGGRGSTTNCEEKDLVILTSKRILLTGSVIGGALLS
jgi:NADH-ubiquinone oxidoreductase chain 5